LEKQQIINSDLNAKTAGRLISGRGNTIKHLEKSIGSTFG
jgi:hypothetical protein